MKQRDGNYIRRCKRCNGFFITPCKNSKYCLACTRGRDFCALTVGYKDLNNKFLKKYNMGVYKKWEL